MLLDGANCAPKEHGLAASGSEKCRALTSANPCHFARNRVIHIARLADTFGVLARGARTQLLD